MSFLRKIITASRDTLYHFMHIHNLPYLVRDNYVLEPTRYSERGPKWEKIDPGGPTGDWREGHPAKWVSFTRNPRLKLEIDSSAFPWVDDRLEMGRKAEYDPGDPFYYNTRITVDGRKLNQKYKIRPYAERKDEAEEVVTLKKGEKGLDIKPFIKKIEVKLAKENPKYNELTAIPVLEYLKKKGVKVDVVDKF